MPHPTASAPNAMALAMSVPRITPPSRMISTSSPTACLIPGSASIVGTLVSSCLPPWLLTHSEVNPWSRALTASSCLTTPLSASSPPHSLASHSASCQLKSGHSCEFTKAAMDSAGTSLEMLA